MLRYLDRRPNKPLPSEGSREEIAVQVMRWFYSFLYLFSLEIHRFNSIYCVKLIFVKRSVSGSMCIKLILKNLFI